MGGTMVLASALLSRRGMTIIGQERQSAKVGVHQRSLRRRPATIRIGYVPLIDAAPLIAAEALGFFGEAGLRVSSEEELGWGSVRERIVYGELDAAHAPGGLLFSIFLGIDAPPRPVQTNLVINLEGIAITLSSRLWQKGVTDGESLRLMICSESPHKPKFGVVSPIRVMSSCFGRGCGDAALIRRKMFARPSFLLRSWLNTCEKVTSTDFVQRRQCLEAFRD
jgi:ABC-type nitrate/sulfonate/bicarbonate transport system substrate-binding protein